MKTLFILGLIASILGLGFGLGLDATIAKNLGIGALILTTVYYAQIADDYGWPCPNILRPIANALG